MRTFGELPTCESLSRDQKNAVGEAGFTVIQAVAGSGKTTSLVARVIRHLAGTPDRSNRLGSVAVITFTTKAAGEITARLMHEIGRLVESAPDAAEREFWLAHLRDVPGAPVGTIDAVGQAFLRRLAVAGRTALDPDFAVAPPEAAAALAGQALSVLRPGGHQPEGWGAPWDVLLRHHSWEELRSAALWLVAAGGNGRDAAAAMRHLADLADRDPAAVLGFQAGFRWFNGAYAKRLVSGLPSDLVRIRNEGENGSRSFQEMVSAIGELAAQPQGWLGTLNGLFDILLTENGVPRSPRGFRDRDGEHRFPALLDLQRRLAVLHRTFPSVAGDPSARLAAGLDSGDPAGRAWWLAWACFWERFQDAFGEACRRANRYPFPGLARMLARALRGMGEGDRIAGLPLGLVLVDEFQDNTRLQWEVCCRLAGKDPDGNPGQWDNLVVVGDPQQAIYSFRGSDPTLIQSVIGLDPSRKKPLLHNRRSLEATLGGINPASSVAAAAVGEAHVELKTEGDGDRDPELAGTFLILPPAPPGTDPRDPASVEADGDVPESGPSSGDGGAELAGDGTGDPGSIALLARELSRLKAAGIPWGEMLVLAHSLTPFIGDLRAELGLAGIPFREMAQEGLWRSREARDIVCLVECLADPQDGMAMLATLRGPVGQLSPGELLVIAQASGDPGPGNWGSLVRGLASLQGRHGEESGPQVPGADGAARRWESMEPARRERIQWLAGKLSGRGGWRSCADRMPHVSLVTRVLEESGAIGAMLADPGSDGAAAGLRGDRIGAVLSAIGEIGDASGLPLRGLARALRELVGGEAREQVAPDLAPGEQRVRLMTIHGAKGLDARVVAVLSPASGGTPQQETFGPRGFRAPSGRILLGSRHAMRPDGDGALSGWQAIEGLPLCGVPAGIGAGAPDLHALACMAELDLQLREKARLFHVAITRAKDRVYLVAGSPSADDPWEVDAWFHHWAAAAGWPGPPDMADQAAPDPEAADRLEATPGPQPLPTFHTVVPATLLAGLLDGLRKGDRQSGLAAGSLRHGLREHLPKVGLDGGGDRPDLGPVVGSLVHRCMELGEAFDPDREEDGNALVSQARSILLAGRGALGGRDGLAGLAGTATRVAIGIVREVARRGEGTLAGILAQPAVVEVPFRMVIGVNWTVAGRIDRLMECGDIVDWKTDSGPPSDLPGKYHDQMALYALAVLRQRGDGFPAGGIRAHLVHTGTGEVVTIPFTRAALEGFAAGLEGLLVS